MKLLNFILSMYLVALSCLPCADIEVDSAMHSVAEHKSEKDKHSHEKSNDLCSPFCVCNCCGQQTLAQFEMMSYFIPVKTEEITTSTPSTYTSPLYSDYYGSIWQPPQIA